MKLQKRTIVALLLLALVGVPLAALAYVSSQTGLSWSETLQQAFAGSVDHPPGVKPDGEQPGSPADKNDFLKSLAIGASSEKPPRISNVNAVDLDQDGRLDVVVCDALADQVVWIRQQADGSFKEQVCAAGIVAPGHSEAVDLDKDGDLDLLVAVLGNIMPSNDKVGEVVVLENQGDMTFKKRIVAKDKGRVSDVRAGDLDGDGDLDLVVNVFGLLEGETLWMENVGDWEFKQHTIQSLSGGIHSELADVDGDGDLDIFVLISQEWEEIYLFLNDGEGMFAPLLIYGSSNEDFGSSGISLSDFDQDGDLDVLYTNGDCFDYIPPRTRLWHGVQWLENKGDFEFEFHRVADFRACYRALPVDIDHDGDLDLFAINGLSLPDDGETQSLIWLENDGKMNFSRHDLASTPGNLMTLALGDFDANGTMDLVTGGMFFYPPFDRLGRVTLWSNQWAAPAAENKSTDDKPASK